MSIFEDAVFNEYRQNAHVQASLNGHILLNKSEFMAWGTQPH